MPKIFLGGTCASTTWRDELIPKLSIEFFNPVVADWTPEAQQEEINQRETCDFVLYALVPEAMSGVYSIAEVIDDSNKRPEKTILCILGNASDEGMSRSLNAVAAMALKNGAKVFHNLDEVASFVNGNPHEKRFV